MSRKTKKSKKVRKYKPHRKTAKSQSGGVIGCGPEDGYTPDIQAANVGVGYTVNPGSLHSNGETLSLEELVYFNNGGMLEWYAKKCKLTQEEYTHIKEIPEVKTLGAFFLRYKIVSENIGKVMSLYSKLKPLPAKQKLRIESGESTDLTKSDIELVDTNNREKLYELRLNIEIAINMTQCMLWHIVKNKGLPADFKMDPRIEALANEPVLLNTYSLIPGQPVDNNLIQFAAMHQYEFISKWIRKTKEVSEMLATSVTFD